MEITENKVTSREVKATETVDGIECAYNVTTNGDTEVARTNGIFKRDGHEIGTMSQNESEISVRTRSKNDYDLQIKLTGIAMEAIPTIQTMLEQEAL